MGKILVLDDERPLLHSLSLSISRAGHECLAAETGAEATKLLAQQSIDLAVLDLQLPDMSGIDVLRRLRVEQPEVPAIVITAFASVETAVEAMKDGALDYLEKPIDLEELLLVIERELANARLRSEVEAYRRDRERLAEEHRLLGESPAIQGVRQWIRRVSEIPVVDVADLPTVLIEGETGTGKELIARGIHDGGSLSKRPFVQVNCAALPRDLVESELFGHEKGSFTGAQEAKQGLLEIAEGGTAFLDEVGLMPLEVQAKLLTAIESKRVRRIGGVREHQLQVRIIAATNLNLAKAVEEEKFRADLYYRLRVLHLKVPPLRDRKEDIELLAQHFFEKFKRKYSKGRLELDDEALSRLKSWHWPGNVREFAHTIEHMVLMSEGGKLQAEGPLESHSESAPKTAGNSFDFENADCRLEAVEKSLITEALEHTDNNVSRVARLLGLSRGALRHKMTKWGIGC